MDLLGRASRDQGHARPLRKFEILPTVPVVFDNDVEAAADSLRPMMALYVGGMGAREVNFHFDVICRLGYEKEANEIQRHYLDGHRDQAISAVPTKMIEDTCLIGPKEKIRDELQIWTASSVTTMLITGSIDTLRTMAELVL